MMSSVHHESFQRAEAEVGTVLVHIKKLRCFRNWLSSPLLRLPTEIIIRILSFIMADLDSAFSLPWLEVHLVCHRLHRIMCNATELWWRVDFAHIQKAQIAFARSKGDPQDIIIDLGAVHYANRLAGIEKMLDRWRVKQRFRGRRLRTLEFRGSPSSFSHISWVLARPLPRLESLTIDLFDDEVLSLTHSSALELPVDVVVPLQVLDLRNVTLSWSSHLRLCSQLRELRLSFRQCEDIVTIEEDDLFGILGALPQLEHLSLLQVGHEVPVRDGRPLPPKRILQLPHLTSLSLDNDPAVINYTLSYMDLPVINSLKICTFISSEMARSLVDLLFPNDHLPLRLFPNPPTFAIRIVDSDSESAASMEIDIGSVGLRLDFYDEESDLGKSIVMSSISNLVPPSVNTLDLEYTNLEERGWRDFFVSHPEVRSINCSEFDQIPVSRTLWDALSPGGEEGGDVPCHGLESISVTFWCEKMLSLSSLSDCLRNRKSAGFKLSRLKMMEYGVSLAYVEGFHDEFVPLVEMAEADTTNGDRQRWGTYYTVNPIDLDETP